MAARLRRNLALNDLSDKVQIEEVALGGTDSVAELNLGRLNLGESSLLSVESNKAIPVTVCPLSRYLPEQRDAYETFVIKLDVEGLEDDVLVPFLKATSPKDMPDAILMETSRAALWSTDLVSLLKQCGYVPLFEGEDRNTLFLRGTYTISGAS